MEALNNRINQPRSETNLRVLMAKQQHDVYLNNTCIENCWQCFCCRFAPNSNNHKIDFVSQWKRSTIHKLRISLVCWLNCEKARIVFLFYVFFYFDFSRSPLFFITLRKLLPLEVFKGEVEQFVNVLSYTLKHNYQLIN